MSNGLRDGAARPRIPMPFEAAELEGPEGSRARRMGCPLALAPSNSRIAMRASARWV